MLPHIIPSHDNYQLDISKLWVKCLNCYNRVRCCIIHVNDNWHFWSIIFNCLKNEVNSLNWIFLNYIISKLHFVYTSVTNVVGPSGQWLFNLFLFSKINFFLSYLNFQWKLLKIQYFSYLRFENFKSPSLNLTHYGLSNISKVYPNSPIISSFDLNKFSLKICSIVNNFSIIGWNIIKSTWCTIIIEGFPIVPRSWQEAPWFGISWTNYLPLYIHSDNLVTRKVIDLNKHRNQFVINLARLVLRILIKLWIIWC